jgi:antitoxin (DNA-binding transcriptional repressor) of toxin-antitoxin stability system
MKDARISELRDDLSRWLRRVERGERVRILRRNEVIAVLSPPGPLDADLDDDLERRLVALEREGAVRRGTRRWPDWLRRQEPGPPAPALEALLAEREEGM